MRLYTGSAMLAGGLNILLIDDDSRGAGRLQALFNEVTVAAFHIIHVRDFDAALKCLATTPAQAVFLDLSRSAFLTAARVARLREVDDSPAIIVLSDYSDDAQALEAMRAGAQDFLVRGQCDGESLARRVRYAVERQRFRRPVRIPSDDVCCARLGTIGETATAIVHELNQPLCAITSYADACLNMLQRGAAMQGLAGALREIAEQARRASELARRVRDFCRRDAVQWVLSDINHVVRAAVDLVAMRTRGEEITVAMELDETLPPIPLDPLLIEQVVLNLLHNGVDAMTGNVPERRKLIVRTCLTGTSHLEVCVADQGCGLPAQIEARLFEPFFTTKPDGMGMGLSICRSVVEAHGGRLWACNNAEGGSSFTFTIPSERE